MLKKIILILLCAVLYSMNIFAEEDKLKTIPILNYDFVSLEKQEFYAPGGGLIFLYGDQNPPVSEKNNNLMAGLFYKSFLLKEHSQEYSGFYHDIDFIVERKIGSHLIQGIFSAFSDCPVYGGFHTTYTSLGYGYEFFRKENIYLTLGLALGAGDYGISLPNGNIWPVLPMPIIRFGLNKKMFNLALDFPRLNFVLLPENRIRLTGTFSMDVYKFHDVHDFKFNSILWCRFFNKDFVAGDFLGAGIGVQNAGQNDGTDFMLGEKGRKYDVNHYSLFGILDAGLLKISGGYVFYSREVFDSDKIRAAGTGWFFSIQGLYQF